MGKIKWTFLYRLHTKKWSVMFFLRLEKKSQNRKTNKKLQNPGKGMIKFPFLGSLDMCLVGPVSSSIFWDTEFQREMRLFSSRRKYILSLNLTTWQLTLPRINIKYIVHKWLSTFGGWRAMKRYRTQKSNSRGWPRR